MCKSEMSLFTLRIQHVIFGLRIGSRGTPWNSKSAGPGGSDFAKCQKVAFIWHFGVFGVLRFFHFFHFSILWFYHFLCFCIFWFSHFCHFLHFVDFDTFSDFVIFTHFRVFLLFWFIFQFREGYLKDKALFWPLLPTIVHSHGKHFGGVISLCEKWALFFTEFL